MNEDLHQDTVLEVSRSLQKNGFQTTFCPTTADAIESIIKLIPVTATVGFGGSLTLQQLGIWEMLVARGNTTYNHSRPGLTREEILETRRKQLTCEIFLTGTNAITRDGKLVNTDGIGNRVAAMIFGPKQTFVIAGVNKIVQDCAEAKKRIKEIAAPMNSRRLNLPNPCVESGSCMDCQGPTRICNVTTVIEKCPSYSKIHVFLIGEPLGY